MSMPEITPIPRQEASRLSEMVSGSYLTPEWQETGLRIDTNQNGTDLIELYPTLPDHAVANSEDVRKFANFKGYPDFFREREEFFKTFRRHKELYYQLGGMHSVARDREDSFKMLADASGLIALEKAGNLETTTNAKGAWYYRFRANILQELGEKTNNFVYLQEANDLNQKIVDNPNIPWSAPYKIHAAFSGLDIADSFLNVEGLNASLGLPETASDIIVAHYRKVIRAASENIKIFQVDDEGEGEIKEQVSSGHINSERSGDIGEPIGAITEQVSIGHLRRRLARRRRSKDTFTRQAYLHEDNGIKYRASRFIRHDMPRTGFDVAMVDRRTGQLHKFEIKKTDSPKYRHVKNMPDVELFALYGQFASNRKTGTEFLEEVRHVSAILEHNWRQRDTALTSGESRHVERIHSRLEFDKSIKEFRAHVGRVALQAMG